MKLGFVNAIPPSWSLEQVVRLAADLGYDCVELMCWPVGGADRRYAGVAHLGTTDFSDAHLPYPRPGRTGGPRSAGMRRAALAQSLTHLRNVQPAGGNAR